MLIPRKQSNAMKTVSTQAAVLRPRRLMLWVRPSRKSLRASSAFAWQPASRRWALSTVEQPRVRAPGGKEMVLLSCDQAVAEDWLGAWAPQPDAAQRLNAQVQAGAATMGLEILKIGGPNRLIVITAKYLFSLWYSWVDSKRRPPDPQSVSSH